MSTEKAPLKVVTREEWGAKPPRRVQLLKHPVKYVRLSQTTHVKAACNTIANCEHSVRERQKLDMDNLGWSDIQPNFLIGDDGRIYEGRGWDVSTDKQTNYEKYEGKMLEIAYLGPFLKEDSPTERFLRKVKEICDYGEENKYLSEDFNYLDQNPELLGVPQK